MLTKVISGGQTGADRAALDAALDIGFPLGGYCPSGRKAEDGVIHARYPLVELEGGYLKRTKKNVAVSDGTVIFYSSLVSGGTEKTLAYCLDLKKPYKLIDSSLVDAAHAATSITEFVRHFSISILNVAGPRQSKCPEIYPYVRDVVADVIGQFADLDLFPE